MIRWLGRWTWMLSVLCVGFAAARGAEGTDRPNVVFILADDLGWGELGCYGQQRLRTPNIDRLATEGMRFTRHYSGAPVCAPSRCVLMTGRHLGKAEIRGNIQAKVRFPEFTEGQHPLSESAFTLAQAFRKAGYATAAMGKWGLGPVGSTGDPGRKGFDLFFGYNCQAVAHSFYPEFLWRNGEKVRVNAKAVPGHRRQPQGEVRMEDQLGEVYSSRLMVAEAERFLAEKRSSPFFLYLPFIEPHVAMHPPKETVERFPKEWDTQPYRGEHGYLPHPRPRAGYAAMVAEWDDHVGRVLKALDAAGLAQRTLVVFTSDNGTTHAGGTTNSHFHIGGVDAAFFNSTAGLRGYKGSVYEGGLRVPMIVRWPGRVAAGTVSSVPGYFADWFPTLCEVAGLERPEGLDGTSLWPVMTGGKGLPRKPMVWVFPEYGGQVAVRIGGMKAVRQRLATKAPGAWEVYDVDADPGETRDLAGDRADIIAQAEQVLREEAKPNAVFPVTIPGL